MFKYDLTCINISYSQKRRMYGHPTNNQQFQVPGLPGAKQSAHPQQYHNQPPFQGGLPQSAAPSHYGAPNPGQGIIKPPLMQPPALNVQQNINTNSQFLPQRAGNNQTDGSNNDHSEFDPYHNQQQEGWNNEQQIAATAFWEQKCYDMLGKFEWFFDRFQLLRNDYNGLSEQIQKLDTQDDWHLFQNHHDQFHQKIIQLEEELSALMGQNQQMYQQKMAHEGQNMWEQRYQELLGNFKSLQENMAQVEANGGGEGGVSVQQYQHLQDQFNQLHYQYGEVVNELQKHQGNTNYQQELQMHLNQYQSEIEKYKEGMDNLHNENVELQNMIVDLQARSKATNQNNGSMDKYKLEELAQLIEQKQMEIQDLQQDFKNRNKNQGMINQYQTTIQEKIAQNDQLKNLIDQMENQLLSEKQKMGLLEEEIGRRLREEYEGEKTVSRNRIQELERNIYETKSKARSDSDSAHRLQMLEKKLANSQQEIKSLNETLKAKNIELTEMREAQYQIENLKDIQKDFKIVSDQKDRLSQNLRRKNIQIEGLHRELQSLTAKVQEVSNKRQEYSTRNLMVEIQDLNDTLRRGQGEISKLKSIIDLKEEYCLKLQEELRKSNDKYIVTEQTLISERQDWKERELRSNNKNTQYDKRMKNLDYQFNLQLKNTLQREVTALRKQNTDKQDVIRKMEEQEVLLSSKLAIFEKQKGNFDKDLSFMKNKENELQKLNEAQSRRFRQLENAYLAKEEELSQIKNDHLSLNKDLSKERIENEEHKSVIKAKNKGIDDLQKQLTEYLGKGQMMDRLKVQNSKLKIAVNATNQQLQKMKLQGQSRVGQSKVSSVVSPPQHHQAAMVQQLQRQNQYLKEEMSKMLEKMSVQNITSNQELDLHEKRSSTSTINLNQRLNEFNSKLQSTIQQHEGLQHSKSQKIVPSWQMQKKQLIKKYQGEIRQLKTQIRNTRMGSDSQISQNSILDPSKRQTYVNLQQDKQKDEMEFYKKKVKELTDRNQNLININGDLRSKIDGILKVKQSTSTNDFLKDQNKNLQTQKDSLKSKLKKSLQENKEYRIELSVKNSKVVQEYEYKMLELELTIQDLKRKITYLQAEKVPGGGIENRKEKSLLIKTNLNESVESSFKKRESMKDYAIESPKYKGIQEEFQSVLGNFKNSPKGQRNNHTNSIDYSPYMYGDSRLK